MHNHYYLHAISRDAFLLCATPASLVAVQKKVAASSEVFARKKKSEPSGNCRRWDPEAVADTGSADLERGFGSEDYMGVTYVGELVVSPRGKTEAINSLVHFQVGNVLMTHFLTFFSGSLSCY
jgi:hypothetical protein